MKKYYPDRKSLNLLRVVSFILLIVILLALKYILYISRVRFPEYFVIEKNTAYEIVVWTLMAVIAMAYVLFILIYLPLLYKATVYEIDGDELVSRTGVFSRTVQYMKISAVQYTTLICAPLSKKTGFNFMVMSAHGGRMIFTFLPYSDALEIAELLKKDIVGKEGDV